MKPGQQLMRHYLQFKDFRAEEYAYLFERAAIIKKRFKNYEKYQPLADRTLAMIFEKASTRTRLSTSRSSAIRSSVSRAASSASTSASAPCWRPLRYSAGSSQNSRL